MIEGECLKMAAAMRLKARWRTRDPEVLAIARMTVHARWLEFRLRYVGAILSKNSVGDSGVHSILGIGRRKNSCFLSSRLNFAAWDARMINAKGECVVIGELFDSKSYCNSFSNGFVFWLYRIRRHSGQERHPDQVEITTSAVEGEGAVLMVDTRAAHLSKGTTTGESKQ